MIHGKMEIIFYIFSGHISLNFEAVCLRNCDYRSAPFGLKFNTHKWHNTVHTVIYTLYTYYI